MPSDTSFTSDPQFARPSDSQLRQDEIQAACLQAIALTDQARQAPDAALRLFSARPRRHAHLHPSSL